MTPQDVWAESGDDGRAWRGSATICVGEHGMGELPAGGLWMRRALRQILSKPSQDLLDQFEKFEGRDPPGALRPTLQALWSEVIRRAMAGEFQIRGIPPGERSSIVLETGLLLASLPDLQKHTLETTACTFSNILIVPPPEPSLEAAPMSPPRPEGKGKGGRQPTMEDAFFQEIVRQALTPDGFASKQQIKQRMENWYAERCGDRAPSDRTVDRWLDRFLPPELPTK